MSKHNLKKSADLLEIAYQLRIINKQINDLDLNGNGVMDFTRHMEKINESIHEISSLVYREIGYQQHQNNIDIKELINSDSEVE